MNFVGTGLLLSCLVSGGARPIVVSENPGGGALQLFAMNADGGSRLQLTNCSHGCMFPSFSPDGRRVVFSEQMPTGVQLGVVNADGSGGQRALTAAPGYSNELPSWVNATHVVFARTDQRSVPPRNYTRCRSSRNGIVGSELRVLDVDAAAAAAAAASKPDASVPLFAPGTRHGAWDAMPSMSPDGTRVAFVSAADSAAVPRVWMADVPDGGNAFAVSAGAQAVDLEGETSSGPRHGLPQRRTPGNPHGALSQRVRDCTAHGVVEAGTRFECCLHFEHTVAASQWQ